MKNLEALELQISKFLRFGVILSAVLLIVGFVLQFKFYGNTLFVFDTYDKIPLWNQLRFHLYHRHWGALSSYLGLGVLISLPVIRVLLTGFLFLKQKDFLLALIAFIVLSGLIISFTFGIEL